MRSRTTTGLALLTGAALALSACSGGDDPEPGDGGSGGGNGDDGSSAEVTLDFFTDKAA